VSHRGAAARRRLLPYTGRRIDVIAVGYRRPPGVVVHRVSHLPDDDRTLVDGIPVTSVPRTLCDLAGVVSPHQLERAVDNAERLGVLDLRAFEHRSVPPVLRDALATYHDSGFTRSDLERRFALLCRDAGLPMPCMNLWIYDQEVDAVWPDHKVAVQLDTYFSHGTPAAFEDDRRRDATLQIAGYSVLRVTGRRLEDDPAGVLAGVRSLLTSRSSLTDASTSSPKSSRSAIAS
jgi:hypothetical protein